MRRGTQDILFGAVMLAIAAFFWWESGAARYQTAMVGHSFGPAFYPRILLVLWLLLAGLLVARGAVRRGEPVAAQAWRPLAGFVAITGAYIWLVTAIGFLFSSVLLCLASTIYLGYRRPVPVVAVSLGVPLLLWYLFVFVIRMPLPASPWFDRI